MPDGAARVINNEIANTGTVEPYYMGWVYLVVMGERRCVSVSLCVCRASLNSPH